MAVEAARLSAEENLPGPAVARVVDGAVADDGSPGAAATVEVLLGGLVGS